LFFYENINFLAPVIFLSIYLYRYYDAVKAEFVARGCYFLKPEEIEKVRRIIIVNGALNAKIVGQSAFTIAGLAGVTVAERLIQDGGYGHTASVYLNALSEKDKLGSFSERMKTCRILVNTPSSQGGIGDMYNFKLLSSLTLGCGSWGATRFPGTWGVKHLINIKTVARRRENMLWFRALENIYLKRGCLPVALEEFKHVMGRKRAFIVTDFFLYKNGYTKPVAAKLEVLGIVHETFFGMEPDPTLACAHNGAVQMTAFRPDVIIAVGGSSAMDAGKIMRVLYEHPEADFQDMAMRFIDIRKRVYAFSRMGGKAFDDQCTGANPRYPLIAEIRGIYLNAYYGPEGRDEG
jgi:acetaldehyde dehydrogenase/alcohol dehydrogenase